MSAAETTLILLGVAALTDRIMRLLEFLEEEHERGQKKRRAAR